MLVGLQHVPSSVGAIAAFPLHDLALFEAVVLAGPPEMQGAF